MALLSGFAGVYTEMIIKKTMQRDINVQNLYLYSYGAIFSSVSMVVQDMDKITSEGMFTGFSFIVLLMIINQAFSGLVVSVILKYADNILKVSIFPNSILCIFQIIIIAQYLYSPHRTISAKERKGYENCLNCETSVLLQNNMPFSSLLSCILTQYRCTPPHLPCFSLRSSVFLCLDSSLLYHLSSVART